MGQGFSRLWVRCNKLVYMGAVLFPIITGFPLIAAAQEQQNPVSAIPQPRPSTPQLVKNKPQPTYQSACPAMLAGKFKATPIKPIIEGECGERSPLLVSAIGENANIALSPPPQINCRMATAMVAWVQKIELAAQQELNTTLKEISVGNGYQCRRRNNLPDGKISEHGFANALDVVGIRFADGKNILVSVEAAVEGGQQLAPTTPQGRFLKSAHFAACELFTTVLGPQADVHHRDHFHLDLGCHGKNCTYRVCQ